MAVAMARQRMAILSSSCSSFTSSSSRVGICSPPATAVAVANSRRIVAPLLFVFCPVQGRAQLTVSAPEGSKRGGGGETSNGGCFDDAIALLASAPVLPKLVVVDLDFTLWPFYCWLFQSWELFPDLSFSADTPPSVQEIFTVECCFSSPSEAVDGTVDGIDKLLLSARHWAYGRVSDHGAPPTVYPQVVDIVKALAAHKVEMAIASRTPSVSVAKTFLNQLSIGQHFNAMEIYFTVYSKSRHFAALQEKTGIPYRSMLFFDDESKNINAVSPTDFGFENVAAKLGVSGVLVKEGLDLKALEKGLDVVASRNW